MAKKTKDTKDTSPKSKKKEEGTALVQRRGRWNNVTRLVLLVALPFVVMYSAAPWLIRGPFVKKQSNEERFVEAWNADLEHLKKHRQLHAGFSDLKTVEYIPTSDKLKTMLTRFPASLPVKSNGHYKLEVFIDEIENHDGVVVQYDLVELKSGNTVWEKGRTFPNQLK